MDDALARQVLCGGDLCTNLLEVTPLDEGLLLDALSTALALPASLPGALSPAFDAVSLLPGALAAAHVVVPLAKADDELVVAVTEPLSTEAHERLTREAGRPLSLRIALAARIKQAQASAYRARIDRRTERLLARLSGDLLARSLPPILLSDAPPMSLPSEASLPPPSFGAGLPGAPRSLRMPRLGSLAGWVPGASVPPAALAPLGSAASPREPAPLPPAPAPLTRSARASVPAPSPPHDAPAERPAADAAPDSAPPSSIAPATLAGTALVGEVARAGSERPRPLRSRPPPRITSRPRGPLSLADAEAELRAASDADAVLGTLFVFATQFFEFAAVAVYRGANVAIWYDGSGASRTRGSERTAPLAGTSLAALRTARAPLVAPLSATGDHALLGALGRASAVGQGHVALLPVLLRDRVVAVVYGDDGANAVQLDELGPVIGLAALAGQALQALLVRRKLAVRRKAMRAATPDAEVRVVAALVEVARHSSAPPPMPDASALDLAELAAATLSPRPPAVESEGTLTALIVDCSEPAKATEKASPAPEEEAPSSAPRRVKLRSRRQTLPWVPESGERDSSTPPPAPTRKR